MERRLQVRNWLAVAALAFAVAEPTDAQLASRPAEEWSKTLEQPARLEGLKISEIISRLGLKPGQVVADLGAGTGIFSVPMAKAVARDLRSRA